MFIYQLVVKVEFGHFFVKLSPAFSCFFGTFMPTGVFDEIWLDVEFWFDLTKVHPFLPCEMGFFAAMKHEVSEWPLPGGWFFLIPTWVKTGNVVFPPWFHHPLAFWGISEVPDLLTGDSECLAGDGESCTLMLGWSWYVDWFSLSIREQWFSISRIKTAVECWMLHVALGIGPCSIEAHENFVTARNALQLTARARGARAEGPTAAAWSQCGGKKWTAWKLSFHFVGCTGVTSGRSSPLMMFDEETEKEPCFCWWCISLCREPPSVQMAAWWEIGLKGYAGHRNATSREGFYCDVD